MLRPFLNVFDIQGDGEKKLTRLKLACRRLAVDSSLGIMKEEFSERFAPMVPPMLKEKVWVTEIERDSAREQVLSFA